MATTAMGGGCVKTQNPRVWRELFPPSGASGKVEQNFLTLIRHQENNVPSLWPPDRVFTQSRLLHADLATQPSCHINWASGAALRDEAADHV